MQELAAQTVNTTVEPSLAGYITDILDIAEVSEAEMSHIFDDLNSSDMEPNAVPDFYAGMLNSLTGSSFTAEEIHGCYIAQDPFMFLPTTEK